VAAARRSEKTALVAFAVRASQTRAGVQCMAQVLSLALNLWPQAGNTQSFI